MKPCSINLPIEISAFLRKGALREKCPDTEFYLSIFSCIRTAYGDLLQISVFSLNTAKYRPEKTLYLDTFHAVCVCVCVEGRGGELKILFEGG